MKTYQLHKVILAPVLTEKTARLNAYNQYVFKVAKSATKQCISHAIAAHFSVVPSKVRIINVKQRSVKRGEGVRPGWKKAIITLKPNDAINLVNENKQ